MIADMAHGARFLLSGFRIILRPGLRRFVAIPALINAVIFSAVIALGALYLDTLIERFIPEWLGWIEFILWPLFALMSLIISYYTFTIVANLLASPFNDRLSEKVAARLGKAPDPVDRGILGDVAESVAAEIRKWLYFAFLAFIVLVLWLFPLTSLLAPFAWILLGAWMMGFEYIAYPLANQRMKFREQRAWMHDHRALVVGFGFAVLGATLIPILNFFVMPAAVAGGTQLWASTVDRAKPSLP